MRFTLAGKKFTSVANDKLIFFVPGIPKPGGSKRVFHNKRTGKAMVTDACKTNKDWRAVVANTALYAMSDNKFDKFESEPLHLSVVFFMPRPKGHYRTGKNAHLLRQSAPAYPTTKPDATKLLRALEDALTGILWRDDAQIVLQMVSKKYVPNEYSCGAMVTVRTMGDGDE